MMEKKNIKLRKYLPSIADLFDRLSTDLLKQIFIVDKKEVYKSEIDDILDDIDLLLQGKEVKITGKLFRAVLLLGQINTHIWYNEKAVREGHLQDQDKLRLTHGINGIRNKAKNKILEEMGETKGFDYKVDCLASEFKDWDVEL